MIRILTLTLLFVLLSCKKDDAITPIIKHEVKVANDTSFFGKNPKRKIKHKKIKKIKQKKHYIIF